MNWSIGTHYIRGEFMRSPQELIQIHAQPTRIEAMTAYGALRIHWGQSKPLIISTPEHDLSTNLPLWTHRWLLPAKPIQNLGLRPLGPDTDAIDPKLRDDELFDLGLGYGQVRMCIRTRDAALVRILNQSHGACLFSDPKARGLNIAIFQSQPHRVFLSPMARIEIYQAIPALGEPTPEGPHTHVFPPVGEHSLQAFRQQQLSQHDAQDVLCLHTSTSLSHHGCVYVTD